MKVWLASLCLLRLVFLQDAFAHVGSNSDIIKQAADHRAIALGQLRQGAARQRNKLLNSIQHVNEKQVKRAETDITWEVSPFNPTSIPLAVRSPYLSTWLWGGTNDRFGDLTTQQASFWNGNTLPWCGTVLVDGQAYTWMGIPSNCAPGGIQATQRSMSFTASKTTFVMRAGTVDITIDFLSPVTPKDLVRQSLPYSYMEVTASPNDNASHSVQIYTDITGEWASNDWNLNITWGKTVLNSTLHVHEISLLNETLYGESQDSTLYGTVVYATDMNSSTTYMSGPSSSLRQTFVTQGKLEDYMDTDYRAISDSQPGFAYAKDFGQVEASANATALFAIGHYRNPGVQYTASGLTAPQSDRSLYFMAEYPSLESSLSFFYNDYATVSSMSAEVDAKIQEDATAAVPGNENYAGLCAIAARQVYGGLEITVGKTSSGSFNTSDIMVFVKEIATSNYVNTVDVIAPFFPFLIYMNPDMIPYSLIPVINYVEQGDFPKSTKSAPHDIGSAYPIADGAHQPDAPYYIEESANMLFMGLAHQRSAGSNSLIAPHYTSFKQWADYLVNSSLSPALQASTDDFAGEEAQMTSLAVKGTVELGCMGQIASALGKTSDANHYTTLAKQYSTQIISSAMATTRDHVKLTYNSSDDSWSSLYNLLPDRMFGLNIFNDSFYAMQGAWYAGEALPYGVPLDSRAINVKTDFAMWMSAIYHGNSTLRDTFINGVYDFLTYGESGQALPDLYNGQNASQVGGFVARPVAGGVFAPLALWSLQSNTSVSISSAGSSSANGGSHGISRADEASSAARRRSFLLW
ncbi:putative glutaminase A [Cystobasidium minutum MCA 4210]|uniref:putative glutaminase A n=1 Tax=Cystobasidium minutum MCA 4210 TaxID=1397322 RepID=UPI0034CDB379|eukprot:jgi/Rhomi1/167923/fgenesh1_kg.2_\